MQEMPLVVVGARLPGAPHQSLDGRCRLVLPEGERLERPALLAAVADADALVTLVAQRVDAALLAAAPRLRLVSNFGVGYDNIDLAAASAAGVLVTNTPDVLTESTADLAFGLLLCAARRVAEGDRLVRAGRWQGWGPGQMLGLDVHGATLGIIGLGRIGRAVARRAAGFGMHVIYWTPRATLRDDAAREAGPRVSSACAPTACASLDELLAASDFVSLHCPLTPATRHLIGPAQLAAMKPGAVLINTARGPVVDEAALAAALAAKTIAAAGLDVYEHEPAVHPGLLALDNVVLAPHIGSATGPTRAAMGRLAIGAVLDWLAGRRPEHLLNPQALDARGRAPPG